MAGEHKAWADFLRAQCCVHCGAGSPQLHHLRDGVGAALKGHDLMAIPLCAECHTRHHAGGLPSPADCRKHLETVLMAATQYMVSMSSTSPVPSGYMLATFKNE